VKIDDTSGDLRHYNIRIRYNGADVSKMFLQQSKITVDREDSRITIENPSVRLPSTEDSHIELSYRSSSGAKAKAVYGPPVCYAFRPRKVLSLGDFKPEGTIIQTIESLSQQRGVSSAFFTALVAQESGFNPKSVSWARAIGLTQVTELASQEVRAEFWNWQSFPGIERMPFPRLKFMIESGRINAKNEWRLNEERSIEGGMAYVRQLSQRWGNEENLKRVRKIYPDPLMTDIVLTQLLLASYNSGFSRVSNALENYGREWIKAPELQEARKYVNRIFSYCDYFADTPEVAAGGKYEPAT